MSDALTLDRIQQPTSNGGTKKRKKRQPARESKATRTSRKPTKAERQLTQKRWATVGVIMTAVLSAGLNGYANSLHASMAWAGWALGISVPLIVVTLGRVATGANHKYVTLMAVLSGLSLLGLSVWHCSESISLLTGSSVWLSLPMAIAIDCGLVSCETALMAEEK